MEDDVEDDVGEERLGRGAVVESGPGEGSEEEEDGVVGLESFVPVRLSCVLDTFWVSLTPGVTAVEPF